MLKASLRGAVLLGLLAWSAPSYAEVQNIRISGEVDVRAFSRKALRMSKDVFNNSAAGPNAATGAVTSPGTAAVGAATPALGGGAVITDSGGDTHTTGVDTVAATAGDLGSSSDSFLQQLTAINIDADLTENVSTQLRVINQRVWGFLNDGGSDQSTVATQSSNNVELALANITLKELFYSPLTLTIGRQNLWFGRGFIVGSRLLAGDNDPGNNLAADEYSDLTGFDAIRATFDLAGTAALDMPVVVDVVYAKVGEDDVSVGDAQTTGVPGTGGVADSSADDTNLIVINAGTEFDNGEGEIYWVDKRVGSLVVTNIGKKPTAKTIGIRGSSFAVEGADIWGELAFQWGHRLTTAAVAYDAEGAAGDDYQAWAANLGADYTLADATWMPTLGAEWIFYSGDDSGQVGGGTGIGGWDPVYRGAFKSLLREFQSAGFYMPAMSGATINADGGSPGASFNNVTNAYTNQHTLAFHGTVHPVEDLMLDNRFSFFFADKGIRTVQRAKRKHHIGTEWDVTANYDYTDDVQIGVLYGIFWPGSVFRDPYDDRAQQLVTSVSVKF